MNEEEQQLPPVTEPKVPEPQKLQEGPEGPSLLDKIETHIRNSWFPELSRNQPWLDGITKYDDEIRRQIRSGEGIFIFRPDDLKPNEDPKEKYPEKFNEMKLRFLYDKYFNQDKLNEFLGYVSEAQKDPTEFSINERKKMDSFRQMYKTFIDANKKKTQDDYINGQEEGSKFLGNTLANVLNTFGLGAANQAKESATSISALGGVVIPGMKEYAEKNELETQIREEAKEEIDPEYKNTVSEYLGGTFASVVPMVFAPEASLIYYGIEGAGNGHRLYQQVKRETGDESSLEGDLATTVGLGALNVILPGALGRLEGRIGQKAAQEVVEGVGKKLLTVEGFKEAATEATKNISKAAVSGAKFGAIQEVGSNIIMSAIDPRKGPGNQGWAPYLYETLKGELIAAGHGAAFGVVAHPLTAPIAKAKAEKRIKEATVPEEKKFTPGEPPTTETDNTLPTPTREDQRRANIQGNLGNDPEQIIREGFLKSGGKESEYNLLKKFASPTHLLEKIVHLEQGKYSPEEAQKIAEDPEGYFIAKGTEASQKGDVQGSKYYFEVANRLNKTDNLNLEEAAVNEHISEQGKDDLLTQAAQGQVAISKDADNAKGQEIAYRKVLSDRGYHVGDFAEQGNELVAKVYTPEEAKKTLIDKITSSAYETREEHPEAFNNLLKSLGRGEETRLIQEHIQDHPEDRSLGLYAISGKEVDNPVLNRTRELEVPEFSLEEERNRVKTEPTTEGRKVSDEEITVPEFTEADPEAFVTAEKAMHKAAEENADEVVKNPEKYSEEDVDGLASAFDQIGRSDLSEKIRKAKTRRSELEKVVDDSFRDILNQSADYDVEEVGRIADTMRKMGFGDKADELVTKFPGAKEKLTKAAEAAADVVSRNPHTMNDEEVGGLTKALREMGREDLATKVEESVKAFKESGKDVDEAVEESPEEKAYIKAFKEELDRRNSEKERKEKSSQSTLKTGDYVQWTSGGSDQFDIPKKIERIEEKDGEKFAFVEGSTTGIPVVELSKQNTPKLPTSLEDVVVDLKRKKGLLKKKKIETVDRIPFSVGDKVAIRLGSGQTSANIRAIHNDTEGRPYAVLDRQIKGNDRVYFTNKEGTDLYLHPIEHEQPVNVSSSIPIPVPIKAEVKYRTPDGSIKNGTVEALTPDGNGFKIKDKDTGEVVDVPMDEASKENEITPTNPLIENEIEQSPVFTSERPELQLHSRGLPESSGRHQLDDSYPGVLLPHQSRNVAIQLDRLFGEFPEGSTGVQGNVALDASGVGTGKSFTQIILAREIYKRTGKPVLIVTENDNIAKQYGKEYVPNPEDPTSSVPVTEKIARQLTKEGKTEEAAAIRKLEGIVIVKYKDFQTLKKRFDKYNKLKKQIEKMKTDSEYFNKLPEDQKKEVSEFADQYLETSRKGYIEKGGYNDVYDRDFGAILFDESQNIRNPFSQTSRLVNSIVDKTLAKNGKVVYYSATPFESTISGVDILSKLNGITRSAMAKRLGIPEFAITPVKEGKHKGNAPKFRLSVVQRERIKEAREALERQGAYISQSYSFWGTKDDRIVYLSPEQETKFQEINDYHLGDGDVEDLNQDQRDNYYRDMKYFLDSAKAESVGEAIVKKLEDNPNRRIVVFAENHKDPKIIKQEAYVQSSITQLKKYLEERGIPYVELHGGTNKKAEREALEKFQNNSEDAKVILTTVEKGGVGINLDDTEGRFPRTVMYTHIPETMTRVEQSMGRVSRQSTKSPSEVMFFYAPEFPSDQAKLNILNNKSNILDASRGTSKANDLRGSIGEETPREREIREESRTVKSKDDLVPIFQKHFGMNAKEAEDVATIWDAAAQTWADNNGRRKEDWYTSAIGGIAVGVPIVVGGSPDRLLQLHLYHGGARLFDIFSNKWIDSGEGTQWEGWGLYFTDKKDIAKIYAESVYALKKELGETVSTQFKSDFIKRNSYLLDTIDEQIEKINSILRLREEGNAFPLLNAMHVGYLFDLTRNDDIRSDIYGYNGVSEYGKDVVDRINHIENNVKEVRNKLNITKKGTAVKLSHGLETTKLNEQQVNMVTKELDSLHDNLSSIKKFLQNDINKAEEEQGPLHKVLYEVVVHKGKDPSEYDYLDWGKAPTSSQKNKIIAQLKKEGFDPSGMKFDVGNKVYSDLQRVIKGDGETDASPEKVSKFLLRSGIDGLVYKENDASEPFRYHNNYVVFDDGEIEIMNRQTLNQLHEDVSADNMAAVGGEYFNLRTLGNMLGDIGKTSLKDNVEMLVQISNEYKRDESPKNNKYLTAKFNTVLNTTKANAEEIIKRSISKSARREGELKRHKDAKYVNQQQQKEINQNVGRIILNDEAYNLAYDLLNALNKVKTPEDVSLGIKRGDILFQDNPLRSLYSEMQRVLEDKLPETTSKIEARSVKGRVSPEKTVINKKTGEEIHIPERKEPDKNYPESSVKEQVLSILKNNGVKDEEIEFSGLPEFLDLKDNVTKKDVLDFVKSKGFDVEVVLLGTKSEAAEKKISELREDFEQNLLKTLPSDEIIRFVSDRGGERTDNAVYAAQLISSEVIHNDAYRTEFSFYLKDLVEKPGSKESDRAKYSSLERSLGRIYGFAARDYDRYTVFDSWTIPGGDNYREMLINLPGNKYVEPHFKSKGTVAHVRMKDRFDENGNKVLFIEEVQSQQHEEGRNRGYSAEENKKNIEAKTEELKDLHYNRHHELDQETIDLRHKEREALLKAASDLHLEMNNFASIGEWKEAVLKKSPRDVVDNILNYTNKLKAIEKQRNELEGKAATLLRERDAIRELGPVENAPFKDTRAWTSLAVKKILQYAVENGYDRVSFTEGSRIEKIVGGKLEKHYNETLPSVVKEVTGEELKTSIISGITNKDEVRLHEYFDDIRYGGRMGEVGARKVSEKTGIPVNEIIESVRKVEQIQNSLTIFDKIRAEKSIDRYIKERDKLVSYWNSKVEEPEFNTLDITPKLKEKILGGLPLFQEKQPVTPTGNRAKGAVVFANDGRAFITALQGADVSTAIHEFAHVLRRNNLTDSDRVIVENHYGVRDGNWEREHEERFARDFERYVYDGKAPNSRLKEVFNRLKEAMRSIYETLSGSPIDNEVAAEIREVFDRILGTDSAAKEVLYQEQDAKTVIDNTSLGKDLLFDIIRRVKANPEGFDLSDIKAQLPQERHTDVDDFANAYATALQNSNKKDVYENPTDRLSFAENAPLPSTRGKRSSSLVKEFKRRVLPDKLNVKLDAVNNMRRSIFTTENRKIFLQSQEVKDPKVREAMFRIGELMGLPLDIRREYGDIKDSFTVDYNMQIKRHGAPLHNIVKEVNDVLHGLGYLPKKLPGKKHMDDGYRMFSNLVRGNRFLDLKSLTPEERKLAPLAQRYRSWEDAMHKYLVEKGALDKRDYVAGHLWRLYDNKALSEKKEAVIDAFKNKLVSVSKGVISEQEAEDAAKRVYQKLLRGSSFDFDISYDSENNRIIRTESMDDKILGRLQKVLKGAGVSVPGTLKDRRLTWMTDKELDDLGILRNDFPAIVHDYLSRSIKYGEFSSRFGRNAEVFEDALKLIADSKEIPSKDQKHIIKTVINAGKGLSGNLGLEFRNDHTTTSKVLDTARALTSWGVMTYSGVHSLSELGMMPVTFGRDAISAYHKTLVSGIKELFTGEPDELIKMIHDFNTTADIIAQKTELNMGTQIDPSRSLINNTNRMFHRYVSLIEPITIAEKAVATAALRNRLNRVFKTEFGDLKGEDLRFMSQLGYGKSESDYNNLRDSYRRYKENGNLSEKEFDALNRVFNQGTVETIVESSAANRVVWGNSRNPLLQVLYQFQSYGDAQRNGNIAYLSDELKHGNAWMLFRLVPLFALVELIKAAQDALLDMFSTEDQKDERESRRYNESGVTKASDDLLMSGLAGPMERVPRAIQGVTRYHQTPFEAIGGATGGFVSDFSAAMLYGIINGDWDRFVKFSGKYAPKTPLGGELIERNVEQSVENAAKADPRYKEKLFEGGRL